MCKTCLIRHAPPTGAKCPRAHAVRSVPKSSNDSVLRRYASRKSPAAVRGTSITRGRLLTATNQCHPRHGLRRLITSSPMEDSPSSIPSSVEETDNDSLDGFPPPSQVSGRKRAGSPLNQSSPSKRPTPDLAPRRSGAGAVSPTPAGTGSPNSSSQDNGTTLILQQLAAMQESNRREFARLENEGRQERLRMEAEHRAATEQLQAEHRAANEQIRLALATLQSQQSPLPSHQVPIPSRSTSVASREPVPSTSRAPPTPASQLQPPAAARPTANSRGSATSD